MKTVKRSHLLIPLIFLLMSLAGFAQESKNQIFDLSSVKISEVTTNTIRSDFGPSVVGDSLYFTSYSDKVLGKTDKKLRKNAFYDLFRAKIDENGNTVSKREPVPEFVTRYHDGPVSYCKATGELFLTQSDNEEASIRPKAHKRDTIRLRIVIAKLVKGKWTTVSNFPYNNPHYSVGHPAISLSGDTLVFSSDQPGGFGKTDLYYSVREHEKWSIPVNMGPQINTSGKEEFSFIAHNQTGRCFLIFASTGRPGFGGLDLYYTQFPYFNNAIEHFGAPINTPDDDFDMIIPDGADYGYLASNRPGTGSDDIYKFTFKKEAAPVVVIPPPPPPPLLPVKELYVYNKLTRKPILDTKVTTCDSVVFSTDQIGKVSLSDNTKKECDVLVKKFGFNPARKILLAKAIAKGGINRDTIWMEPTIGKITLLNIYYDLDKSDILPEAAAELDRLITFMNENPELKVQLSSHTDSRGNDAYNMKLSERRAQSAVRYIVSHGIKADRISGKGYGETRLLNRCANGVNCTPQEHRQNRRTEIFIPELGKSNDVKQTEGDRSGSPDQRQNYPANAKKTGMHDSGTTGKAIPKYKAKPPVKTKTSKGSSPKSTAAPSSRENGEVATKVQSDPKTANPGSDDNSGEKVGKKTDKSLTGSAVGTISRVSKSRDKLYYVIISSFRQKNNAERFLTDVTRKGIHAQIIIEAPYFRIGIAHNSLKEARETKDKIRREFVGCWIW